jgi:hypothetical protein
MQAPGAVNLFFSVRLFSPSGPLCLFSHLFLFPTPPASLFSFSTRLYLTFSCHATRVNPLFLPISRLFFSTFSISLRNSWASRPVVRDDAVAQREPAFVVDEAVGSVAVLEGETENGNGCSLYHANSIPTLATADRELPYTWTTNRQVLRNVQITARQPNSSTQTSVEEALLSISTSSGSAVS